MELETRKESKSLEKNMSLGQFLIKINSLFDQEEKIDELKDTIQMFLTNTDKFQNITFPQIFNIVKKLNEFDIAKKLNENQNAAPFLSMQLTNGTNAANCFANILQKSLTTITDIDRAIIKNDKQKYKTLIANRRISLVNFLLSSQNTMPILFAKCSNGKTLCEEYMLDSTILIEDKASTTQKIFLQEKKYQTQFVEIMTNNSNDLLVDILNCTNKETQDKFYSIHNKKMEVEYDIEEPIFESEKNLQQQENKGQITTLKETENYSYNVEIENESKNIHSIYDMFFESGLNSVAEEIEEPEIDPVITTAEITEGFRSVWYVSFKDPISRNSESYQDTFINFQSKRIKTNPLQDTYYVNDTDRNKYIQKSKSSEKGNDKNSSRTQ